MKRSLFFLILIGILYFAGLSVMAGVFKGYSNEKPTTPIPKECCILPDARS
ncbi:MAG: hypothetical protein R3301_06960 [Saprospiraceae bacterium]|nr:hypothetical protein [Saprospiraceae bacterium]